MTLLALLLAVATQSAAPPPSAAPTPTTDAARVEQNDTCLSCHGEAGLEKTLPSGEVQSLVVSHETFAKSVHGDKLACTDCHTDITEVPHEARPFRTKREFSVAYYEACKRCHFANYSQTLDSAHAAAVARGDKTAPLCVDCHGSHDISLPSEPRTKISQTCSRCHAGVSQTYTASVHGSGIAEGNPDVPTCTDCHRSHDVAGPHKAGWKNRTPELCASCHADEQLMQKYGLSANVMSTYVSDFHGVTASLRAGSDDRNAAVVARCTDCHGVHDIVRVDAPNSRVLKANLVKTCAQCHEDASENFPDAWLSHYEPSLQRTPLVYLVTLGYKFLIPFMIGGLLLQVMLHLWRVVVNR
ncbi:MAG: cytochrome C [Vicinamibacteraceae bacterium]|nr:cytochrome C [Vicinamibacteraceae bacterium]